MLTGIYLGRTCVFDEPGNEKMIKQNVNPESCRKELSEYCYYNICRFLVVEN